MKIAVREHTDIVAGATDEIAVTIQANAVSFMASVSGLATDKIGYALRELCSNAWDAARGDFTVSLPTRLDPTLRIRDRGPGMEATAMRERYPVLYASDKRDDNTKVGSWGAGRFSAFAYLIGEEGAASYTVTSYTDGRARTYLVSISSAGTPVLRLLLDVESDEPTGMEVAFAVRNADIDLFHTKAREVLWSFEPRPTVTPEINWGQSEVRLSGDGWTIYKGTMPFTGPQVRIGCAMYPISLSQVENPDGFVSPHTPIVFEAPIGSLSPSLSRETLAYDERTKRTLSQIIARYKAAYTEALSARVEACDTFFEACKVAAEDDYSSGLFALLSWRGTELRRVVSGLHGEGGESPYEIPVTLMPDGWRADNYDRFERGTVHAPSCAGCTVVVEHNPGSSIKCLQAAGLEGKKVLWVRLKRADLDAFKARIGNPEVVILDSFRAQVEAGRPKAVRVRRQLVVGERGAVTVETKPIDLSLGGLYIHGYTEQSYSVAYTKVSQCRNLRSQELRSSIEEMFRLGLIEAGTSILLKTDNETPGEGWKWFGDVMIERLRVMADGFTPDGLEGKTAGDLGNQIAFLRRMHLHHLPYEPIRQIRQRADALVRQLQQRQTASHAQRAHQLLHKVYEPRAMQDFTLDPIATLQSDLETICRDKPLLLILMKAGADVQIGSSWHRRTDLTFEQVSTALRETMALLASQAEPSRQAA